ncbi:hypothetical protein PRIPAC_87793 [Pristionchus pacificus]|uniref:Uncharacterized protein n=1 Tax=Pristionchus pacificus TaxID=54126 RepID=A0A2A6CYV2_PRIPA|nr:hypothetical protein PRIPAC_87793 [Pristionchus pacificus]|eukprot:PDM83349.1 hypothetical protein PRIPAC_34981 [Pristionchus pacificus]
MPRLSTNTIRFYTPTVTPSATSTTASADASQAHSVTNNATMCDIEESELECPYPWMYCAYFLKECHDNPNCLDKRGWCMPFNEVPYTKIVNFNSEEEEEQEEEEELFIL